MRILGLLFVCGCVGGAFADNVFHVQFGVLSYPHPDLLGQAWWVGPQFGVATIGILLGAGMFAPRVAAPAARDFVTGAAWFVGAYLASGVVDHLRLRPELLLGAYLATFGARVAARPAAERAPVMLYAALLAVGGVLYEGTLAATGAFSYGRPDVYHVAMWLPGIYLHGGPLGLALARKLGLGAGGAPRATS